MAFTATLLTKERLPGGNVRETYLWNGDSVTTGTITADVTIDPVIVQVTACDASSDGDSAALTWAQDAGANKLKLTFASSDTGRACIEGRAA